MYVWRRWVEGGGIGDITIREDPNGQESQLEFNWVYQLVRERERARAREEKGEESTKEKYRQIERGREKVSYKARGTEGNLASTILQFFHLVHYPGLFLSFYFGPGPGIIRSGKPQGSQWMFFKSALLWHSEEDECLRTSWRGWRGTFTFPGEADGVHSILGSEWEERVCNTGAQGQTMDSAHLPLHLDVSTNLRRTPWHLQHQLYPVSSSKLVAISCVEYLNLF